MTAGIRDVLIISTPQDAPRFEAMLGDGSQWGMNIQSAGAAGAGRTATGVIIGKQFIGGDPSALILATIFSYGHDLGKTT